MTTEKKIIGGITLLTIAIVIVGVIFLSKGNNPPVPADQVVAQNGLHWHPKLSIYIKGEKKELEDKIGIGAIHQPIHTHTEDYKDGVVHMEMSGVVTRDETKLDNFFRIWGKDFNATQIFDKKNSEDGKVKIIVNGKENNDFENYKMRDSDTIEIRYE